MERQVIESYKINVLNVSIITFARYPLPNSKKCIKQGSTSFKIAEALISSGIKTGLFVSPHIASFRERVQVNGTLISESEFTYHMSKIMKICAECEIPATMFELAFILATVFFDTSQCGAVVLEVGLGGEVDATNVVNTSLSIICSVSLDHTRILGSTVEAIARKKGGIFKAGIHAVVGPQVPWQVNL